MAPRSPRRLALGWRLPSKGGGPSPPEQGATPVAVMWLTREDVGPAVVALPPLFLQHSSGHCKYRTPPHLPSSSFSVHRRYKLVELVCYVIMGFFPALVIISMVSHCREACGLSTRDKFQWGWIISGGLAWSRLCDG